MEPRQTEHGHERIERRSLLMGAIYVLPLLMGGTLTALIGNYLLGRQRSQESGWADAGEVADMQSGTPRLVRFERAVIDGWKVHNEQSSAWIIVDEQRRATAFSPLCTHLGCAYHWQSERNAFTCPCHGSAFNIRGDVIAGPASRPLDRYSAKLQGNRLWLGPVQGTQGT